MWLFLTSYYTCSSAFPKGVAAYSIVTADTQARLAERNTKPGHLRSQTSSAASRLHNLEPSLPQFLLSEGVDPSHGVIVKAGVFGSVWRTLDVVVHTCHSSSPEG